MSPKINQLEGRNGFTVTVGQWVVARVTGRYPAFAHVHDIHEDGKITVGIHFHMNGSVHKRAKMYRTVSIDQLSPLPKNPPKSVVERMEAGPAPSKTRRRK